MLYDGDFENGVYHGFGRLRNYKHLRPLDVGSRPELSHEIYKRYFGIDSANFVNDVKAKRGLLDVNFNDSNWESYEGYFSRGQKHGVGRLVLKDGRDFEGEFMHGKVSGYGVLRFFGQKTVGKWSENYLVNFL